MLEGLPVSKFLLISCYILCGCAGYLTNQQCYFTSGAAAPVSSYFFGSASCG